MTRFETEFENPELNVLRGQCAIYALWEPDHPEKGPRYIGKTTVSIETRRRGHAYNARHEKPDTHLQRWLRVLASREMEPVAMMLELCTPEMVDEAEEWWIARGREIGWDLVNTAKGGTGGKLAPAPESIRSGDAARKAWETRRANGEGPSPLKGKKQDPEFVARRVAAIDYEAVGQKVKDTLAARKAAGIPHPNAGRVPWNKGKRRDG